MKLLATVSSGAVSAVRCSDTTKAGAMFARFTALRHRVISYKCSLVQRSPGIQTMLAQQEQRYQWLDAI